MIRALNPLQSSESFTVPETFLISFDQCVRVISATVGKCGIARRQFAGPGRQA